LGSIASITPNGAGLEFRNIRTHPKDGTWEMSGPTTIPQITPSLDGGPLQHLCWGPNGSDLAVIDAAGRIAILTLGHSLNRPNFTRSSQMDSPEELHAVVGAYWLNLSPNTQRPVSQFYAYGDPF
jgi:mediator of RNA polymerase II transcription subunit 16